LICMHEAAVIFISANVSDWLIAVHEVAAAIFIFEHVIWLITVQGP
jgi:hypothetical protein